MTIRTVCVVGAGNMGTGIAQACAQAGLQVRLVDQDRAIVDKAKARMREGLEGLVAKGRMDAATADAIVGRVEAHGDLKKATTGIDLAIEAVFESYDAKRPVFAALDQAAPKEAILATNTSSLSVTRLASATRHPGRVAGLHFFFPAMINRLVEVVRGDATDAAVFQELLSFSRTIGKVPIETKDAAGFCVNRFFVPIMNEACRLLQEKKGDMPTIDAAYNRLFGAQMGPFALMNATGVPISLHAQRTLHEAFGPFYEPAAALVRQVEQVKAPWTIEGTVDEGALEYIGERFLGVAVGIAAQLVEEGVATIEDTEKGATVGLRWAQGPFAIANKIGTHKALSAVSAIYMRWGDRFPVAQSLRSLGAEDRPFPIRVVSLQAEGAVARITIERPGQLNALNTQVLDDLGAAIERLAADPALRVAVLTGEGKAFVAGADLKALHEARPGAARAFTEQGQRIFRRIETIDKPVIAAMNGFALGGGLELALACDILYCAEEAEIGLPETGLGIMPGFGGTQRLARRVGAGRARELIFTARRLRGEEAARLGLVDAAFPADALLEAAMKTAATIARNAPLGIAYSKRAIRDGLDRPLPDGLELEQELAIATFGTDDQREGFEAFLARRAPRFGGS